MAYRQTDQIRERLAARHDAIIAAARALAGERGMDAVQIVPVAARAGIAAGTVYRYFPAKTTLVEALVSAHAEIELTALRRAADAAPGPLSALAAAIVTLAARTLRQRRLSWAVIGEPVEAEIDRARAPFRQMLTAEMEQRVAAAVTEKQLPEIDAALAARALVGALLEALIGPLAPDVGTDAAKGREVVQMIGLLALRGVGIPDARARGLVVQCVWPQADAAEAKAV
jgi:AcrR family transcriptional regulator